MLIVASKKIGGLSRPHYSWQRWRGSLPWPLSERAGTLYRAGERHSVQSNRKDVLPSSLNALHQIKSQADKASSTTEGGGVAIRSSQVAIIGDGAGALITLGVLQTAGISAENIAIYGSSPHPLAQLTQRMSYIGQQHMRSEGTSHLAPRDFPSLVWRDAWERRNPGLLLTALFDAYTPPVRQLLAHSLRLAEKLRFTACQVWSRVGLLRRDGNWLLIEDEQGNEIGRTQHAILTLGHGGLHRPFPHASHAYQPHIIPKGSHVVILGGGLAAAHLWDKALNANATVTTLTRHPLRYQPLNAPRNQFSTAAIQPYQAASEGQRLTQLKVVQRGSIRWQWGRARRLQNAQRRGAWHHRQADVARLIPTDSGVTVCLADGSEFSADQAICATGFDPNPCAHPLIHTLIQTGQAHLINRYLAVNNNFTLSPISQPDSLVGVIGAAARWALPIADTFAGLKYAARRLALEITA